MQLVISSSVFIFRIFSTHFLVPTECSIRFPLSLSIFEIRISRSDFLSISTRFIFKIRSTKFADLAETNRKSDLEIRISKIESERGNRMEHSVGTKKWVLKILKMKTELEISFRQYIWSQKSFIRQTNRRDKKKVNLNFYSSSSNRHLYNNMMNGANQWFLSTLFLLFSWCFWSKKSVSLRFFC